MDYCSSLTLPSADHSMDIISPFDALPVELISAIFEWSLQDGRKDGSVSPERCQRDYHRRLSVISQINHRLREIAINTPVLWTTIHISERVPTSSLSRVRSLLVRSKASPLNVLLYADEHLQGESPAIELLCREMKRWRSVHIRTDKLDEESREKLVALLHRSFRRWEPTELTTIQLSIPSGGSQSIVAAPRSAALRQLSLTSIGFDWSATSLSFPQLRRLSLQHLLREAAPSSSAFLRFLSNSPRLEEISLSDVDASVHEWSLIDPSVIRLPSLKALTLEHVPLPFIHHLLTALDAPALKSMRLAPEESTTDSISWAPFLFGFSSVDSFEWGFGNGPMSSDAGIFQIRAFFSHLIRRLPNVSTMKVSSPSATQLLHELSLSTTPESSPFPNLVDMTYSNAKNCLELIVSTIKSRPDSATKITRLSMCATDVSLPLSAGQRRLQAMDDTMDWLGKEIKTLDIRNKQGSNAFRYTFLGWKDCMSHSKYGRDLEYEQEMEE